MEVCAFMKFYNIDTTTCRKTKIVLNKTNSFGY